jgi:hypothetical protein
MDHSEKFEVCAEKAIELDEVVELNEEDLDKIAGGRPNDGIVCWWEPGKAYYTLVCMCV